MKVTIEASQTEFDTKRHDLLNILVEKGFEVICKAKPRKSKLLAHQQMVEYWDKRFEIMAKQLKREISMIIDYNEVK